LNALDFEGRRMATLVCPVRGCTAALRREARSASCPRGHSFDFARSGYLNLLQPQERRSKSPGDSVAAARARRRLAEAGHERGMLAEILAELDRSLASRGREADFSVLDVGCGEGFLLGSLAADRPIEAHGVDISVPAIDLAARRYPGPTWVVANADRVLPWADGSFDFITSITARRNGPEFRRLLAKEGRVVVAVPAADDLIELREAVLGRGDRKDRASSAIEDLRPDLTLESRRTVRSRVRLAAAAARDLLASTYRGARYRERTRADAVDRIELTVSRDLLAFRAKM
jgi:23S rRNA (guanine745-N1)-methyltransferase